MSFKIISHRGCLSGPDNKDENAPWQIREALNIGFDVEIDLWYNNNKLSLGHDSPTYDIAEDFLTDKMWIHCKNYEAVEYMRNKNINWFWHDLDKMTLTSQGFIWCFPDVYVAGGITVDLGTPHIINKNILGVCTDYPIEWKKYMELK